MSYDKFILAVSVSLVGSLAWSAPAAATCTDGGPCIAPGVEDPSLTISPELSCLNASVDGPPPGSNQQVVTAELFNDCDSAVAFMGTVGNREDFEVESGESTELTGIPGSRGNHEPANFPGEAGETASVAYEFTLAGSDAGQYTLSYEYTVTTEQDRSDFNDQCSWVYCSGGGGDVAGGGDDDSSGTTGSDTSTTADAGDSDSTGGQGGCSTTQHGPTSRGAWVVLLLGLVVARRSV